ncbi:MAG: hypothetical protein C5B60_06515 [Chloroflexi bacterium]|nr:MAG: hypothetical protein C5B60_06515 [Chloroflexota bacterium]
MRVVVLNVLKDYGSAFLAVIVATVIRYGLSPWLPSGVPFITFYLAVMFAAWKGGLAPGLLASFLSVILADFFFIEPLYQLTFNSNYIVSLCVFSIETACIVLLTEHSRTLRESEENFRYIFETAGVSIFEEDWSAIRDLLHQLRLQGVTDLRAHLDRHPQIVMEAIPLVKIINVNDYTLQLFEAPSKAVLLGSLDRIFVPETAQVFKEELIAAWEGRDIYRDQAPVRTLTGEDLAVFFTLVVPRRETDWKRVMVTLTDITVLSQAEAALREKEERLRTAMSAGQMGAWGVELTTGTLTWDARQAEIFGLPVGKAPANREEFYALVHPEDIDRVKRAAAAGELTGRFFEEFRVIRPDGSTRWIAGQGAIVVDEHGKPGRMVGVNYDITDRKEAQVRVERFAEELERRVTARTAELVQSQDQLRALATELNLAEQRERKRLATELHDHLQQLLVLGKMQIGQGKRFALGVPGCDTVMKKVDDLLSEALTYTRTLVAELSPTVLRDHGLAAGLKWLGEYMHKYNLAVTVTVQDNGEVKLPEDQAVLIFQSVRELLINSWKHSGTGRASVSLHQRDRELEIKVTDGGKGFDLADTAADRDSVAGITSKFGLFSIRERMRALGGSFNIHSEPDKGTCATLTLPLVRFSATQQVPLEEIQLAPANSTVQGASRRDISVRVLLVDDHAMVRQGLRSILTGYSELEIVGEAANGVEALSAVEQHRPKVVIMDINMPQMDGIEATGRIKVRYPDTRIIGLSVNAGRENQAAMLKAGASMLLTKDAAVDELYQAIQSVFAP